ncbi:uncharacterized protein LOC143125815 isoform X2 [Alosa pseudoharengus]|uniref:uncharacterized protein LOC143125815 isoform X2 n=1 Tax=Alosa pseudoharengus TaxID=34774 RepID=UPI003F8A6356
MIFPYILLLLIIYVYTDGTPHQSDTRLIAKTGENVTLKCKINVTSADIQSIFWIRMKQPKELQYVLGTFPHTTTFAQYDGFSEQRFKAINENGKYNLQIYDFQDSDSESESRFQDSTGNTTACEISTEKETLMGYVVGLGVALSVCVAVKSFLIAFRLRRSVCEHCKERAQKQMHCNNSVVEETRMHLDDVIYTTVIYSIKTFKSQRM